MGKEYETDTQVGLEKKVQQLTQVQERMQDEYKQIQVKFAESLSQKADVEIELREMVKEKTALLDQQEVLRKSIADLQHRLEKALKDNAVIISNKNNASNKYEILFQQNHNLKKQIAILEEARDRIRSEATDSSDVLLKLSRSHHSLTEQLEEAQQGRLGLQSQLSSVTKSIEILKGTQSYQFIALIWKRLSLMGFKNGFANSLTLI